jgi:hypothetical protein
MKLRHNPLNLPLAAPTVEKGATRPPRRDGPSIGLEICDQLAPSQTKLSEPLANGPRQSLLTRPQSLC